MATPAETRAAIEKELAAGGCILPTTGETASDRGIRLASNSVLAARTTAALRTVLPQGLFGDNCTVQAIQPDGYAGIGYADSCTVSGQSVTLPSQDIARQYAPGSYCFTYKWNGYAADGARNRLHRVLARSNATLSLDNLPDPMANAAVWTRQAITCADAVEGKRTVTASVKAGQWVLITAGPRLGNECVGELRYVTESANGRITLDRPLRSSYSAAALAVVLTPVVNATVQDLTIRPYSRDFHPAAFKHCVNLTLRDCTIEGDLHLFACRDVAIIGCRIAGTINANNCRDVFIRGTRCREFYIEEMCSDWDVSGFRVTQTRPGGAGFNQPEKSPCERIRLRAGMIEGCGDLPLHLRGRENVVDGVTIAGSQATVSWIASDISGDGLRVRDLRSDLTVKISGGAQCSLSGVRGPLHLVGGSGSITDCPGAVAASPAIAAAWGMPATA